MAATRLNLTRPQSSRSDGTSARSTSGSLADGARSGVRRGRACRTACPEPRSSRSTRASREPNRPHGKTPRSSSSGGRGSRVRRRCARPRGLLAREAARRCRCPADRGGPRRSPDALLGGARMTYGEAGSALGEHPNRLRYAAPTGTVAIRGTARGSRPLDPAATRHRPARRAPRARAPVPAHLRSHHARGVRRVGRDPLASRHRHVRRAPQVADARADTDRRRVDPHPRRADVPRRSWAPGVREAPPERRRLLPPLGSRPRTPCPGRRPSRCALDPSGLAGCRPRRGRSGRDVATRGGDGHRPTLALSSRSACDAVEREAESLPLPGMERRIVVRWSADPRLSTAPLSVRVRVRRSVPARPDRRCRGSCRRRCGRGRRRAEHLAHRRLHPGEPQGHARLLGELEDLAHLRRPLRVDEVDALAVEHDPGDAGRRQRRPRGPGPPGRPRWRRTGRRPAAGPRPRGTARRRDARPAPGTPACPAPVPAGASAGASRPR